MDASRPMNRSLAWVAGITALLALGLTACGGGSSSTSSASTSTTTPPSGGGSTTPTSTTFALTSTAMLDSGTLPMAFTCDGAKFTPPLSWAGAPSGTAAYALLMTTLPGDGSTKWNWVLYDIPASTAELKMNSTGVGTLGAADDGAGNAYAPPCSQGPGAKVYTFTLYALSAKPTFTQPASQLTGSVVTAALQSLTLASAKLSVSYTRQTSTPPPRPARTARSSRRRWPPTRGAWGWTAAPPTTAR